MKAKFSKKITRYNFGKDSDARKEYYGWENTDASESEDKVIEVTSIQDKCDEIIRLAKENGYSMKYFDLKFEKVPDKTLRKEVRFEAKDARRY